MALPDSGPPHSQLAHAVLVADDDAIIRDLLRSLLTRAGYTVVAAGDGDEALALAQHLDASLAIIDLAMPHRDGLQTCEALHQLPNWRDVPIMMLTGHHTDQVLRDARRAGVNSFMCKPFVPAELLQRVARLTGNNIATEAHAPMAWKPPESDLRRTQPSPTAVEWQGPAPPAEGGAGLLQLYRRIASAPPRPAPAVSNDDAVVVERHRILVAEDDEMTRTFITQVLSHEGYLVDAVSNGQQALTAITTGRYDLVLMELRMPVLNGINTTRAIRSLPNSKRDTVVVGMTAKAFNQFTQEPRDTGLNGCLMKPVSAESLLACVRQHLGGQVTRGAGLTKPDLAKAFDIDRIRAAGPVLAPGAMLRLPENLLSAIAEFIASAWRRTKPDPLYPRSPLHNPTDTTGTEDCASLSDDTRPFEAADASLPSLPVRVVHATRATIDAICRYLGRKPQSTASARP